MSDAAMDRPAPLGRFERWLTLWIALAIILGIIIGSIAPGLVGAVAAAEVVDGGGGQLEVEVPLGVMDLDVLPVNVHVSDVPLEAGGAVQVVDGDGEHQISLC